MCHPKWHVGRGNAIPNGMFPPGFPFKNPPHTVSWEGPQNRAPNFSYFRSKFARAKNESFGRWPFFLKPRPMTVAAIQRALRNAASIDLFTKRKTRRSRGFIVSLCVRVITFLAGAKTEVPKLLDAVCKRMKLGPTKKRQTHLEKCEKVVADLVTAAKLPKKATV